MKDRKRLDLRVLSAEKETIARAAALSGRTVSEFVRGTMLAAANGEIREHEVIRLTNEGSRAFVAALMEPPEPNENLRRLARDSGLARPPEGGAPTRMPTWRPSSPDRTASAWPLSDKRHVVQDRDSGQAASPPANQG